MKTATLAVLSLAAAVLACQAAVPITSAGSPYSEDFNSLAASGTANSWANDSTLSGWSLFSQPSPGAAIATYAAGTGSSGTGNFYSFGTDLNERAIGGVGSGGAYFGSPAAGAIAGWIAVNLVNTSGGAFNGFNVSWNGEQWRNGGNINSQTMIFEYGFGPSFGAVSSWTAPGGNFDFTSLANTSTAAAVDGNGAGRVSGLGGVVSNLNWNSGEGLWLRWVEKNDSGNDHGLAIDDFSFRATAPASVADGGTTLALLGITLFGLSAMGRRFRHGRQSPSPALHA